MKKTKFISLATLLVASLMLLSELRVSAQVDYFKDFKTPLSLEEICLNSSILYARGWKYNTYDGSETQSSFSQNADYKTYYQTYENLINIFSLDVISYYKLKDEYNTQLKVSVFQKSAEYKEKLEELKKIKIKTQNAYHYVLLHKMQAQYTNNQQYSDVCSVEFGNYIMQKSGFKCKIRYSSNLLNSIYDGFKFPCLPITYSDKTTWQSKFIFIPMSQQNALDFESTDKENICVLILFKPDGGLITEKTNPSSIAKETIKKIVINKLRFIVINNKTDKVYFDKIYSIPKK